MANKKITDVDVVSTVSDADYLFVNQGQSIKQIKKSDIPKPIYNAEEVGALPNTTKIPSKTSDLQNDSGFLTEHQDLSGYALKSEVPKSASDVGADAAGTAESKVSVHNTETDSHNDIRELISGLTQRLNALADSDDTTLDQMSEVVAYIKSNKSLIDAITTSKINVSDIIDDLATNVSNKPLSAAQGVKLKALIDAIATVELDETLTDNTKAAPAGVVGELKEDLTQLDSRLSESKIDKPTTADNNKFPRAKNGNVEWVEQGLPTDAQTETAVQNWLNAHPEATTTVDNRIVKKVHNTVNSMINDYSLKVDEKVQTLGYYAPSDFGGNSYVVSQTPSNELAIQLNNGLYANPVLSNILNVCAYGVKVQLANIADGSYEPCDNALQKIIEYASGYNTNTAIKSLFFPAGFYYFDNPINLEDVTNINIFGDSKASSGTATFVFYNSDGIVLAGTQYVNISNVSIVCKKENSNGIYYKYINDKRCEMNRFENISISASICINMQCGCGYDYFVNVSTTKGTAPYYPQTIDKFVHTEYSGKIVGVNYIYFDRCSCQGITYGFHFEEVEYAYIYHCDIVDVEYGVYCVGKNVIKHVQLESNVFWDNTVCAISAYSEEKVPSYIITKSNLIKMISNHDGIYTKNAKAYDIAGLAGKYISNVELDDIIEVEEDHIEKLFTIDFVYGLVLRTPFPVTTPTALDGVGFCSITNIVKDMTQKNYPAFRVAVPASGNITVQKNFYTWYMPSNFISVPRYGGTSLADFTVAPTVNGNKLSIKFTNKTATEIALVVKPEVSVGNDIY